MNTKKSLKASGLSLVLCLAMLIGTTFAWFTDSITNSGNKIQAGSLDIGAVSYDVDAAGDKTVTIPGVNGDKAFKFEASGSDLENVTDPIINDTLWEPGKTNAKLLEVKNKGSLAAKVKLDFKVEEAGLQDALWFDFVMVDNNGAVQGTFQKRPMSQLQTVANGVEVKLDAKKNVRFVLVYGMNEEAGNEYQGKAFVADVAIKATQLNKETDGFNNPDYDKDAQYATPVFTSKDFEAAAEKGGVVELKKNITLDKKYIEVKKDLTIVGNGNTLKAPTTGDKKDRVINVSDTTDPVKLTLKNVNIDGPKTGAYNRGVSFYNVQGGLDLTMDNCSVSTNYYAVNIASQCKDVDVTIKNSTLTGYAALQTHSPDNKITLDNCVLVGNNDFAKDEWNSFATIVINQTAGNTNLVLNNCTIKANQPTGNNQYYLSVRSENNHIVVNNCKYFYNGEEQSIEKAMKNVQLYSANNSIKVDGVEMVK